MKTPFYKSRARETKETYHTEDRPEIMNRDIKKVADVVATLEKANPTTMEQYRKGIEDAQDAQRAAARAKETAETEIDFNKACDDESHARDKEAFFKRQLDRLTFSPRMEEATYNKHVQAVQTAVEKAAEDFRRTAQRAIQEIMDAKAAYMATATEADKVLTDLDAAANVLQSKYRYRTVTFTGDNPPQNVEDPSEWRRHAVRYIGTGKACYLVTRTGGEWDSILCAAWNAAERAAK